MEWSDKAIESAYQMAKASLEIEGLSLPEGAKELIQKKLRGEISEQDFKRAVLEIAKA